MNAENDAEENIYEVEALEVEPEPEGGSASIADDHYYAEDDEFDEFDGGADDDDFRAHVRTPTPTSRARNSARRRAPSARKRTILIVVVIAAAAVLLAVLIVGTPEPTGLNVYVSKQTNGVTVIVDMTTSGLGEIDDHATLTVKHDGETVHERSIAIVGNGAELDIAFDEFVVANGDYQFIVTYAELSGSGAVQDLNRVVEKLTIVISPSIDEETPEFQMSSAQSFNVTFYMVDEAGSTAIGFDEPGTMQMTVVNIDSETTVVDQRVLPVYTDRSATSEVDYIGPGTYRVTVSYTNPLAISSSDYKTLEEQFDLELNQWPKPLFEITNQDSQGQIEDEKSGIGVEATAKVNGSASFDTDGEIVSWEWDFNYQDGAGFQRDDTGQTTEHLYTTDGTYVIALRVTDDSGATQIEQQGVVVRDSIL